MNYNRRGIYALWWAVWRTDSNLLLDLALRLQVHRLGLFQLFAAGDRAEERLDAVTGLSGSGPAYVYMVIEAFIAGGLKMGLSREISTKLAEQTVLGAAKHVRTTGLHPAILRDEVITPGGTTIVAIHELERLGLRSMLISAIESATKHARERGKALVHKLEN